MKNQINIVQKEVKINKIHIPIDNEKITMNTSTSNVDETIRKLKFKDKALVISAPAELESAFLKAGFKNYFDKKEKSSNTLVFLNNKKELLDFLNKDLKKIEADSVLWLAYPKGTSKIKSDINRDIIRETAEECDITTVTAISIDDTWSALRFRPIDRVGK